MNHKESNLFYASQAVMVQMVPVSFFKIGSAANQIA